MVKSFDIVIVGLGPTGAVLANMLGQLGWSVLGIEREEDLYYAPRAVHFDDEIMRIFQSIGLENEILSTSEAFHKMEFMLKPEGKPIASGLVGSQDLRYGFPGAFWFHQPTLEKHLHEGLKRFPNVEIIYGNEVIDIKQNVQTVEIFLQGINDSIQCKYVIGCDGGRSSVRKIANLALESADFDQAWVVVDTKTKDGLKEPDLPNSHRQYCNPSQPVTYVPIAGPYYEWQFMIVDNRSEKEAVDPAYVRQLLKNYVDLNKVEITRIAYYKFHGLWATKWRNKRIIIAGDAAHQMPPFLGQGMCSGIRDASSLAWRLDLVLKNMTDESIIDTYETERYTHVKHIINGAILLGGIIQTTNKWKALLRNMFLFKPLAYSNVFRTWFTQKANRKKPLEKGLIGNNISQLAGHLCIQPKVSIGRNEILLDNLLGNKFAIIQKLDDQIFIHQLGLTELSNFKIEQLSTEKPIMCKSLLNWIEQHHVDFILIRPDKYIFDAGRMEELPKVIDNLFNMIPYHKMN